MANWGTVLEIKKDRAIVMADDCKFETVKLRPDMAIGQEIAYDSSDLYKSKNKASKFWPVVAAAAVFLLVFSSSFFFKQPQAFAYVDCDINPSVEFVLNEQREVTGTVALNDDGEEVLKDLSLKGKDFKTAIKEYIDEAVEKGYLTLDQGKNILLSYSVESDAGKTAEQKFKTYLTGIENLTKTDDYKTTIIKVDEKVKELADKNGISMGKEAAYLDTLKDKKDLTVNEIKKYSVADLVKIISVNDASDKTVKTSSANYEFVYNSSSQTDTSNGTASKSASVSGSVSNGSASASVSGSVSNGSASSGTKSSGSVSATLPDGATVVAGYSNENGIVLSWDKISSENLSKYELVISKNDSTPTYPDNGYISISDNTQTSLTINNSIAYTSGDFGKYLTIGQSYYINITAVYKDGTKVASNTLKLTYPKIDPTTQTLTAKTTLTADGKINVSWNKLSTDGFCGYKVVLSKDASTPVLSESNVLLNITNNSTTSYETGSLSSIISGNFNLNFIKGQTCYISVVAVYENNVCVSSKPLLTQFN